MTLDELVPGGKRALAIGFPLEQRNAKDVESLRMGRVFRQDHIQFGNRLIDMPALQQRTAAIGTHIDVVRIYFKSLCINPGGFLKVAFVIPEVAEFSQGLKVLWISFDGILQLAHQCWICLLRGRRSPT